MLAQMSIAQALNLIKDQYKDLGKGLSRLRFRLDISATDNFSISLVDDNSETRLESGYGTTYDREKYTTGSHFFRIHGLYLITEAYFFPTLEAFMRNVEATTNSFSVVYYDLELEYNIFTIVAHNEQGFLSQITHAINPTDCRIPTRPYAPFCLSKPRIDK